jgi:hypothetical protein
VPFVSFYCATNPCLTCLAPIGLVGTLTVGILYICSENMFTHAAVEFENRFWTIWTFFLSLTFVFADDSPLRFPPSCDGLGWFVIILAMYAVHTYDRLLRRNDLNKRPVGMTRQLSVNFSVDTRNNAREKLKKLKELVNIIDNAWFSSALQNVFYILGVLYAEHEIISIFSSVDAQELTIILSAASDSIELGRVFYKMKDHRWWGQPNRTKLLDLLCVTRVNDLSVAAKGIVLDALMNMKLSAHPQSEAYVKNVIINTGKSSPEDLVELKCLMDSKLDVNSMHKLIFVDIRNDKIRKEILSHIDKIGKQLASHRVIKTKNIGGRLSQYSWRKILSDIDDTLYCSGGAYPNGIDLSYAKKTIYPGAIQFYRELDLGTSGVDHWDENRLGERTISVA